MGIFSFFSKRFNKKVNKPERSIVELYKEALETSTNHYVDFIMKRLDTPVTIASILSESSAFDNIYGPALKESIINKLKTKPADPQIDQFLKYF